MITNIFAVISTAITQFLNCLVSSVSGVTELFYDSTANGGSGDMTFLGTLLLIVVGVGIVYYSFRLIMSLVRRV